MSIRHNPPRQHRPNVGRAPVAIPASARKAPMAAKPSAANAQFNAQAAKRNLASKKITPGQAVAAGLTNIK